MQVFGYFFPFLTKLTQPTDCTNNSVFQLLENFVLKQFTIDKHFNNISLYSQQVSEIHSIHMIGRDELIQLLTSSLKRNSSFHGCERDPHEENGSSKIIQQLHSVDGRNHFNNRHFQKNEDKIALGEQIFLFILDEINFE